MEKLNTCTICGIPTVDGVMIEDKLIVTCENCYKLVFFQVELAYAKINLEEAGYKQKVYN